MIYVCFAPESGHTESRLIFPRQISNGLRRRLGELIRAQKETVGLAQGRRSDLLPNGKEVHRPTLKEAGIDHKLSSRAQKLAAVPP